MSKLTFEAPVSVCGIAFIVKGYATEGRPATHWEPAEEPEMYMEDISVVGQPDADADELLNCIRVQTRIVDGKIIGIDGIDLIEKEVIQYLNGLEADNFVEPDSND